MDSNDGLRNLEPMAFYGSPRSRWQVWALVLSVLTTPFCVLLLGIATDSTALSSTEQRSYLVMGGALGVVVILLLRSAFSKSWKTVDGLIVDSQAQNITFTMRRMTGRIERKISTSDVKRLTVHSLGSYQGIPIDRLRFDLSTGEVIRFDPGPFLSSSRKALEGIGLSVQS